jgi:hypothetical protein
MDKVQNYDSCINVVTIGISFKKCKQNSEIHY